ncbi:MAG TPA: helix-turn-helix domain-containing protein [Alphaproteobacteria bacterium]|nr:helix-turn-helix domain-containing protein [Alphaproteobacteria bacterium]
MQVQTVAKSTPRIDFAALTLCRGLGQQATSRIATISTIQSVSASQVVFYEGDEADSIYEVVRGTLKIYKLLPDGRRQITGFLSEGHLLGLSLDGTYTYSAEAMTDLVLCRYPRSHFDRIVSEMPGLAQRLLTATSDELRAAQDQMLLLGRKSAEEKIASFLLMLARSHSLGDEENVLEIPMGRDDIADYLGLSIETVSRTLTKLKRAGIIALPMSSRVVLQDRGRLEELAGGEFAESL